jgi:hypothetical protein
MTLGRMKELFGIAHVRDDEEEVPNAKHMHVVEEDVPVPAAPLSRSGQKEGVALSLYRPQ